MLKKFTLQKFTKYSMHTMHTINKIQNQQIQTYTYYAISTYSTILKKSLYMYKAQSTINKAPAPAPAKSNTIPSQILKLL